jgi:hypothetical protein
VAKLLPPPETGKAPGPGLIGLLGLLLLAGPGCGGHRSAPAPGGSTLAVAPPAPPMADFVPPGGDTLTILVPDSATGKLRGKAVAAAPAVGPELLAQRAELLLADSDSPFPAGTRLLALYELEGGQVVVDLSSEVRQLKGSAGEQWAVAALVDTLALDRPKLQGVRILVDGQPGESLGHLDLSEPFAPILSMLPEKVEKK